MKRIWKSGMLVLLFVAGPVAVSFGDSFEEIEKKLDEAAKSVKSMQMKSSMEMKMAQPGFEMSSKMKGMHWQKRDGDKLMMRMEGETKSKQKMGDTEQETAQTVLMVSDGEIVYTLTDSDGTKMATKTKASPDEQPWRAVKADNDFKVLDDEKVDGADCYVFEMTPKKKEGGDQSHTVFYCRKDCGMPVKTVTYGPDGQAMSTMLFTDIEMNVDIPAEKFKFEVPEGVQVMDMTGA